MMTAQVDVLGEWDSSLSFDCYSLKIAFLLKSAKIGYFNYFCLLFTIFPVHLYSICQFFHEKSRLILEFLHISIFCLPSVIDLCNGLKKELRSIFP